MRTHTLLLATALAGAAFVGALAPGAAASPGCRDLVFVIDGTGRCEGNLVGTDASGCVAPIIVAGHPEACKAYDCDDADPDCPRPPADGCNASVATVAFAGCTAGERDGNGNNGCIGGFVILAPGTGGDACQAGDGELVGDGGRGCAAPVVVAGSGSDVHGKCHGGDGGSGAENLTGGEGGDGCVGWVVTSLDDMSCHGGDGGEGKDGGVGCAADVVLALGGCKGGAPGTGGEGGVGCAGILIVSLEGCEGGGGALGCAGDVIVDVNGCGGGCDGLVIATIHGCEGGCEGAVVATIGGCRGQCEAFILIGLGPSSCSETGGAPNSAACSGGAILAAGGGCQGTNSQGDWGSDCSGTLLSVC